MFKKNKTDSKHLFKGLGDFFKKKKERKQNFKVKAGEKKQAAKVKIEDKKEAAKNKLLKKGKLARSISFTLSGVLLGIFLIFIFVTITYTQGALQSRMQSHLETTAKSNALQVQQVLNTATLASENMNSYMQKYYRNRKPEPVKEPEKTEEGGDTAVLPSEKGEASQVFPYVMLQREEKLAESYIVNTAFNISKSNPDIMGIGAMFEPYKMTNSLEDYSFYVYSNNDSSVLTIMGGYNSYSNMEYYRAVKETGQTVFTPPHPSQGTLVVTAATPITYEGEFMGVIIVDIAVENFNRIDSGDGQYETMFSFIVSQDGTMEYSSRNAEEVGKSLNDVIGDQIETGKITTMAATGQPFNTAITMNGKGTQAYGFPLDAGAETWQSITFIESSEVNKATSTIILLLSGMTLVALVIVVLVITVITNSKLKPIVTLVTAAEDISKGHLDLDLQVKSKDEIGVLANVFNDTAATLKLMIGDISRVLNSIANKDLDVKSDVEYTGDFAKIKESMVNIIDNMNEVVSNISESADQVSGGAEQVSSGSQALSQGATEQAGAIEELSATISEISEQVKHTATNSVEASNRTSQSAEDITMCNEQMKQLALSMDKINESSNSIGKIIKTIEDIAFQTNILALNAAVEAARAGTAGKGFAVVADEVRNLASKSADAAKNTTQLIEESIRSVREGIAIAGKTAAALQGVVEGAQQVTDSVDAIARAANQQATAITQIAQGVDQISAVVQTNSATAEQSAAASEELSGQAEILKSLVRQFNLKGTSFNEKSSSTPIQLSGTAITYTANDDKY